LGKPARKPSKKKKGLRKRPPKGENVVQDPKRPNPKMRGSRGGQEKVRDELPKERHRPPLVGGTRKGGKPQESKIGSAH